MQPTTPRDDQASQATQPNWFGTAAGMLVLHWVLVFGWGLALNDSARGYLYCRITVPSDFELMDTPWLFTFGGTFFILVLGLLDYRLFRLSRRLAVYPSIAFAFTQLFLLWLGIRSRHY